MTDYKINDLYLEEHRQKGYLEKGYISLTDLPDGLNANELDSLYFRMGSELDDIQSDINSYFNHHPENNIVAIYQVPGKCRYIIKLSTPANPTARHFMRGTTKETYEQDKSKYFDKEAHAHNVRMIERQGETSDRLKERVENLLDLLKDNLDYTDQILDCNSSLTIKNSRLKNQIDLLSDQIKLRDLPDD